MDRKIEKKTFTRKRIALGAAVLLVVILLGYALWSAASGGRTLRVERAKLTIATVTEGPFQEFIAVTGTAAPGRTVYLESPVGGRVEEIYVRSGAIVEEDDPILRLSNSDLQMRLLNNEARLAEQVSRLQSMRFQIEQSRLQLRQQLAQMRYEIRRLERTFERQQQLYEQGYIADHKFYATKDELQYWRNRRQLTRRAYRQDSLAQAARLQRMATSVRNMRQGFEALQEQLANLVVRAPISGQLTALDAEIGQIRSRGARFGQIDVLDRFKVRAMIDEFYIARVRPGQTATTEPIGGTRYEMKITRVYPEVTDGRFRVDLQFTGEAPEDLRRGQTIRLRLELSAPEEALLLARGGFYQSTGGNWAYILTGEGAAVRQPIRLGRQNPEYFEVLGGLEPGDKVVTSSYETFGEAERLVFE